MQIKRTWEGVGEEGSRAARDKKGASGASGKRRAGQHTLRIPLYSRAPSSHRLRCQETSPDQIPMPSHPVSTGFCVVFFIPPDLLASM